ncbi:MULTISPECIES: MarR family winged helix-turn-helix transcriptional regulator [unclassified Mesorhizobium]|uniref:MarR family winged helix-turn-helix transcriptional regulator n=1 Tax=unclassified Mesorhizobium TaxID=325217 RepID=UPI00112741B6|nr:MULTISPECIES: MarR family winged helix-turn-helix transcriptional regulator [unclassified Mesorhizobium]MBZ9811014.1 MarR family winged helix-turn-helix transcriptional regulator [Mesorhizobium sp. ESP-6-2]TPM27790.1 winged helix-turn-helix transcriptional regulator [Mesorhizobium sp. B2-2-2]
MASNVASEVTQNCLLTRTRRISRVLTGIYDQELRPFGVNSPQFSLLVLIARLGVTTRAEIGRANHQDRSTLTRNLQLLLSQGWIEEIAQTAGRGRPIELTKAGRDLLGEAVPGWRKAQARATKLLGKDAVAVVAGIADRLPP